jgi:group II intron reverse transcriptase/maturase
MRNAWRILEIVKCRGEKRLPLERVYRLLRNKDLFLEAYGKLAPNAGALTKGVNSDDTIDAMSLERIDTLIEQLRSKRYVWTPVKRIYIPKRSGKKRPLGLPGFNDKLVQEVIRRVLEAYYEPQFADTSHGFRPKRGCHTALQNIRSGWGGVKWFIEGDIRGCFDNIDHATLLQIIGRNIHDKPFLDLLQGMLRAGYVEQWKYNHTYSGVPQGGVLSPLLTNILLNELDQFIETQLMPRYNRGQRRKRNPIYNQLDKRMQKARTKHDKEGYKRLRQLKRRVPTGDPNDPGFRRLKYCRYADDFLLGFAGPREEAERIKQEISAFLSRLKLTLSQEKTVITHATTQKARFLSYDIDIMHHDAYLSRTRNGIKKRAANGSIRLSMPTSAVEAQMRKCTKKGKAYHRAELAVRSDYEITFLYGVEFQGLLNYYAYASNVARVMGQLKYFMEGSLLKTLAHKHRSTLTKMAKRYKQKVDGINAVVVTVLRDGRKPLVATFGGQSLRSRKWTELEDVKPTPYVVVASRTELVQRLMARRCELCEKAGQVEVHHIRALRDVRRRYQGRPNPPAWAIHLMERQRKTIIVCHECHRAIHAGEYDSIRVRSVNRPK